MNICTPTMNIYIGPKHPTGSVRHIVEADIAITPDGEVFKARTTDLRALDLDQRLKAADDRCYDRFKYGTAVTHATRGAGIVIPRLANRPEYDTSGRRWIHWADARGILQYSFPEALMIIPLEEHPFRGSIVWSEIKDKALRYQLREEFRATGGDINSNAAVAAFLGGQCAFTGKGL